MKNNRQLLRFLIRSFPVFWALLIAFLSLTPQDIAEKWWFEFFIPADKLAHFIIYMVFTFSILLSINFENLPIKLSLQIIFVAITVILYGILMEMLQKTDFIGRSANFGDVVSDSIGVLAGILLFFSLKNKLLIHQKI